MVWEMLITILTGWTMSEVFVNRANAVYKYISSNLFKVEATMINVKSSAGDDVCAGRSLKRTVITQNTAEWQYGMRVAWS